MWCFLWALLFPLLTSACLCPSCGCGGGGYGGGYGGGGYSGGYGYGQPYNTFFNQPIPAGRGVEVRASFYGQQAQPQYLPPLQAPPQYAQYPPHAPQINQGYALPVPRPYPSNPVAPRLNTGYELPVQSKSVGWQPARQVEVLRSRAIAPATVAPYTGTTRIVPAKKAGKNSDYEYYYVYYDENGKKTGTSTAKPKLHDGSIQSRSTSAPQNTIDEYDFDDAKDVGGEVIITTVAPVTGPVTIPLPNVTPAAVAVPMFDEPHGEVHAVEEETTSAVASSEPAESSARTTAATSVAVEDGDPIYEDIDGGNKGKITTTEVPSTEAPVQVETVTFETSAPTTEETATETTAGSAAPSAETVTGKEEPKMYEYEEYEVEEIQLVNENGVTETVTRIITTTKAPPKRHV